MDTISPARASFVARFGEADAIAIESAAERHIVFDSPIHLGDNRGTDPFRYLMLTAIAFECVGRFRDDHGITATEEALREWALAEGDLGGHDGDVPDYMCLIAGMYEPWVRHEAAS